MAKTEAMNQDTLQGLEQLISYEPETGLFRWKKTVATRAKQGTIAGCVRPKVSGILLQFTYNKKKHRVQGGRAAWYLQTGEDPGDKIIDHIDGDRNNNCFDNLRLVTKLENSWNRKGVKGYFKYRNHFVVEITHKKKIVYKKSFKTEQEAAKAYRKKVIELRKEYCPVNSDG